MGRSGSVKIKRLHRFTHIGAQFIPRVRLRDNAFAQRLGDEATISLLGDFKNKLVHRTRLLPFRRRDKLLQRFSQEPGKESGCEDVACNIGAIGHCRRNMNTPDQIDLRRAVFVAGLW